MIGTTAFGGGSVTVWGAFLVHFIFCNCKLDLHALQGKKSLKIPKGQSESVYIEEEQTTQWPKEKVQKDIQRSTKHTHKT
jgi:hypothetical protein